MFKQIVKGLKWIPRKIKGEAADDLRETVQFVIRVGAEEIDEVSPGLAALLSGKGCRLVIKLEPME